MHFFLTPRYRFDILCHDRWGPTFFRDAKIELRKPVRPSSVASSAPPCLSRCSTIPGEGSQWVLPLSACWREFVFAKYFKVARGELGRRISFRATIGEPDSFLFWCSASYLARSAFLRIGGP